MDSFEKLKAKQKDAEARITEAYASGATVLNLQGLDLTELPSQIIELSQLQVLDVSGNQLVRLPGWLGQLSRLQGIDISRNQLTTLPEELGQLTQLLDLDVSCNQLMVMPEGLGRLMHLQWLIVADNQLDELPDWLGELRHLQRLDASRNRLTRVPRGVGLLQRLQGLDLSGNLLTELPDELCQLTRLQWLKLWNNQLTALPDGLGQLVRLHELAVGGNRIRALPEELNQLTQLQRLMVWGNQLTMLPEWLGQLTELFELDVSANQLTALPEGLWQLTQLLYLDVSGNLLTILPEDVGLLTQLQRLSISGNQLIALPEALGKLTRLLDLDVSRNQLSVLPEMLGQLKRLQRLNVSGNQLTTLPEGTGQLMQVKRIVAVNNQLMTLPEALKNLTKLEALFLHGNPDLGFPPEVLGPDESQLGARPASVSGILEYYFSSRVSRPLNEAKLILVGRGGVGKTSLVERLVRHRFDPHEERTDGIAITPWEIDIGQDIIRLNIWDFGGQDIMHATHQFFFTKRSLYLLVLNAREGEQDANIEYWLRLIESFGGESPVIVVINKIKGNPFDLNRRGLQEKFPSIQEFVQTDCEDGLGIGTLFRAVQRETDRLEHLRDPFPATWFKMKDKLAGLDQNYISYEMYQQLCADDGIADVTSQNTLVGFLHDLGIVLNFRDDPRLAETHVLNPHWVTQGIYKILNAETFADRKGELHVADLATVLDPTDYPRGMHRFVLDLMKKFELCYEFYDSNGRYLVPELLGKEEPELKEFGVDDILRFEYHYNILPEGLLPRFIVRARGPNKDLPRWRTGAILEFEGNRALVKADIQERKVCIAVVGDPAGRRRLLTVIRSDFEHLHGSIPRLRVQEKVPVSEHPKESIDYAKLRKMEVSNIAKFTDVIADNIVELDVTKLLDGVEEPIARRREASREVAVEAKHAVRVVFSYSHKDEELRDQLGTHLKLLERQGVIATWHDRRILAGEDWKGVIDERFQKAELILLLVSADFIESDYCYDIEMKTSLEQHAKGQTVVAPIILRECQWHKAPFAKLKPLPKNGDAVMNWPNRDKAWTTVAHGIEELAEKIRGSSIQ